MILTCGHGFDKPTQCITCMEDGPVAPPPRRPRVEADFFMNAKFDSRCPACDGPIREGERIGNTELGWCCSSCTRTP